MFSVPGLLLPVVAFELVHLDEEVVRGRVLSHHLEHVRGDGHLSVVLTHRSVAERSAGHRVEPV